jgi:NAD(P)-dependent dehydrogenase (short-subunit alcohol dehydrogenase family)
MPDLKRMLIIGASRGLGLALVREHLERGWQVTATVRSKSAELEALQREAGDRLAIELLDVTDAAQAAGLAGTLAGRTFDLLFLNAGIMVGRGMPLDDIPDGDIAGIFMTNAISPVRVADKLFANVAPGGMIAFMSSILGSVGGNDDGRAELYRASKAALNSLIRSFRHRHGDADITILALHPGVVRTAMGGPQAPLDIETSVKGVADVIAGRWGSGGDAFIDYRNDTIPW